MSEKKKTCFVISPIGKPGSDIRFRSDIVLNSIIKPTAEGLGYTVERSDKIPNPGRITHQIIERIIENDLIIADLSFGNPNVFYELAVRHMTKKPFVQLIELSHPFPFDVRETRTIQMEFKNVDEYDRYRTGLVNQIVAVEKTPNDVDNPISGSLKILEYEKSKDPMLEGIAKILSMLENQSDPAGNRGHPFWNIGYSGFSGYSGSTPSQTMRHHPEEEEKLSMILPMMNGLEILIGNIAQSEKQSEREGYLKETMALIGQVKIIINRGLAELKKIEEKEWAESMADGAYDYDPP
jgi:hypothetical protein